MERLTTHCGLLCAPQDKLLKQHKETRELKREFRDRDDEKRSAEAHQAARPVPTMYPSPPITPSALPACLTSSASTSYLRVPPAMSRSPLGSRA